MERGDESCQSDDSTEYKGEPQQDDIRDDDYSDDDDVDFDPILEGEDGGSVKEAEDKNFTGKRGKGESHLKELKRFYWFKFKSTICSNTL